MPLERWVGVTDGHETPRLEGRALRVVGAPFWPLLMQAKPCVGVYAYAKWSIIDGGTSGRSPILGATPVSAGLSFESKLRAGTNTPR